MKFKLVLTLLFLFVSSGSRGVFDGNTNLDPSSPTPTAVATPTPTPTAVAKLNPNGPKSDHRNLPLWQTASDGQKLLLVCSMASILAVFFLGFGRVVFSKRRYPLVFDGKFGTFIALLFFGGFCGVVLFFVLVLRSS